MRSFQTLDSFERDTEQGVLYLTAANQKQENAALIAMRHEGAYVVISASLGPLEVAVRPRLNDMVQMLARLRPANNMQTPRQVGTGQAYIALGLQTDGTLLMRPTIVADATGHLSFNLALTDAVRRELFAWLPVQELPTDES